MRRFQILRENTYSEQNTYFNHLFFAFTKDAFEYVPRVEIYHHAVFNRHLQRNTILIDLLKLDKYDVLFI